MNNLRALHHPQLSHATADLVRSLQELSHQASADEPDDQYSFGPPQITVTDTHIEAQCEDLTVTLALAENGNGNPRVSDMTMVVDDKLIANLELSEDEPRWPSRLSHYRRFLQGVWDMVVASNARTDAIEQRIATMRRVDGGVAEVQDAVRDDVQEAMGAVVVERRFENGITVRFPSLTVAEIPQDLKAALALAADPKTYGTVSVATSVGRLEEGKPGLAPGQGPNVIRTQDLTRLPIAAGYTLKVARMREDERTFDRAQVEHVREGGGRNTDRPVWLVGTVDAVQQSAEQPWHDAWALYLSLLQGSGGEEYPVRLGRLKAVAPDAASISYEYIGGRANDPSQVLQHLERQYPGLGSLFGNREFLQAMRSLPFPPNAAGRGGSVYCQRLATIFEAEARKVLNGMLTRKKEAQAAEHATTKAESAETAQISSVDVLGQNAGLLQQVRAYFDPRNSGRRAELETGLRSSVTTLMQCATFGAALVAIHARLGGRRHEYHLTFEPSRNRETYWRNVLRALRTKLDATKE